MLAAQLHDVRLGPLGRDDEILAPMLAADQRPIEEHLLRIFH